MDNYSNCMAYLNKMDAAVSGSGGHNQTLKAALACKRFNLTRAEMWNAMQWFNDNRCDPKWSEHELRHKVDSVADLAVKKPLGQRGNFKHNAPRAFVAPAKPESKPDTRPVKERSEQEEERWWQQVAASRGVTLADWDRDDDVPAQG